MSFMSIIFGKKGVKSYEQIQADIDLYERKKNLESDRQLLEREKEAYHELHVHRRKCAEGARDLEHEYHYAREQKMTELAKLDAEIEYKKGIINNADALKEKSVLFQGQALDYKAKYEASSAVIASLKETIGLMEDMMKVITGKLPKVEFDKLNVNVTSKVENK